MRVLTAEDASAYHRLRLLALKESPDAFGSTYEETVSRTVDQFAAMLIPSDVSLTMGVFDDGNDLVATATLIRENRRKSAHKCELVGMYVAPDARGKGLAKRLLNELIAKAREIPGLEQIHLLVVSSNHTAARLYASMGFRPYGVEPRALKDGDRYFDETLMCLMLDGAGQEREYTS